MQYIHLIVLIMLFSTGLFCSVCAEPIGNKKSESVSDWDWKPVWRDEGDCGPNALYVLMALEGRKISLYDIKKRLPFSPLKGCSLEAMQQTADSFEFPVEVRFVKPNEISDLPLPFILHGVTSREKNLGHFIVVAGFDKKTRNFALIDPVRETFGWNPEESVLYGYSGYVLVPKYPVARMWNRIAGISLILCGIGIVGTFLIRAYYK